MEIVIFWTIIYFIPAAIAEFGTKHHNHRSIFILNLFLGWTLIGWVIALVWAVSKPAPVR